MSHAKPGLRFWLPWGAAIAVLCAAYLMLVTVLRPALDQPLRIIVTGAGTIIFTLALIGLTSLPRRALQQRGLEGPTRPAYRRYMLRFLPPMMIYVLVLLAATYYWKISHPAGLVALLVALAPSVPVLFAIRAMILLLREESDEYLRARLYEAWALSTGGTLAICTVWGFLDLFKVVPHVQLWAVLPIWALCLVPAQLLLGRRYS